MRCRVFLLIVFSALLNASAHAAVVTGGITVLPVDARQDVILPTTSPLNTTGSEIRLNGVLARGSFRSVRATQVGTTIDFSGGSFTGRGIHPALGGFDLLGGSLHGFADITAQLTNVVQNPSHPGFATGDPNSIISGSMRIVVPNYGIRLDNGVNLELRDQFVFVSNFDGLPPSLGTLYFSNPLDQQLNAYLAGTNTVAAISTNRTLTAVPEPSAVALLSVAGLGFVVRRRRTT